MTATTGFTVLVDTGCPMCRGFADWLIGQPLLAPLDLVPAGSMQARALFPTLDHSRTLDEITVVASDGAIYTKEHAWVVCLWATHAHRGLAERLARPAMMPFARAAAYAAAGLRRQLTTTPAGAAGPRSGGDYIDLCDGACRPVGQG